MVARTAFFIWLVTVLVNTLLVTVAFCFPFDGEFFNPRFTADILPMLFIAFMVSCVVSIPAGILLSVVLSACVNRGLNASQLRTRVIISGAVLATTTLCFLSYCFNVHLSDTMQLLIIPLASVGAGIASQWKALKQLSSNDLQTEIHEN